MRLPAVEGVIRRRLLVNYRADPEVVQRLLPAPFAPKLQGPYAIVGICLIRLDRLRPSGFPALFALASENAAHRVAVTWTDAGGETRDGVYILRRDSNSRFNALTGSRVFPGVHHAAHFSVADDGEHVDIAYAARDGSVSAQVTGDRAQFLPADSCFDSPSEASQFFECGSCGYSAAWAGDRLDGLELRVRDWRTDPFAVSAVHSSVFEDESVFPAGSAVLDHALVMRNINHEWHAIAAPQVSLSAEATSC